MRMNGLWIAAYLIGAATAWGQTVDLPTSKQLIGEIPGRPQRMNSLPMSMAVSPDGRFVVTVNSGFGVYESQYKQSLAVMDTRTGVLTDFPDDRTLARTAKQTLYSGLAFSRDGSHLYASLGSITDPLGADKDATGNGLLVYRFEAGKVAFDHVIRLPLERLAAGKTSKSAEAEVTELGIPFSAAIADFGAGHAERLLVAGNLSDDVLVVDPATGGVDRRFDLSESNAVPATYPADLAVAKDGRRAFVALENASEIVELDLARGVVGRKLPLLKPQNPVAPGTHPCALRFSPDEGTLYVALANRDAVAAVTIAAGQFALKGYFDTRLPGQSYFGAIPVALALDATGNRLYAANMASDAVAVLDTRQLTVKVGRKGMVEPDGFIPTDWLPISLVFAPDGKLYVVTGKGKGTGPNNFKQRETEEMQTLKIKTGTTYIGTLLYGSLAVLDAAEIEKNLAQWTRVVLDSNRMKAAKEKLQFAADANPIRHVIYIIKENRTYDQILGDLSQDGKAVGNGDASLTMYGAEVTPNLHKLALQFGVLDNFFDSGEVSGDGHVWSAAAIDSDYTEKTWQQSYRGSQRSYDYEGVVADGYPLLQKIPDVNEPMSGYLWGNLARHGKTYYHFGEFISSTFCDQKMVADPKLGPMLKGARCAHKAYAPGEALPEAWGGGVNQWPWPIPALATNIATKPELVGHFAEESPDFNLAVPDQVRVAIFLRHLKGWLADRAGGNDTMPDFVMLRLPNDHTAGTTPAGPTPKSSVADNDLAVGRAVEAISHSPYWDDTAFFILEDDAQNGADHVDAHRSIGLVVSKYAPHGP
jgi:DNA-binding beta-propeller fold protein YncE